MRYLNFALALCIVSLEIFSQSGECPGQHCSAKAQIVNLMCSQLGNQGRPVFVEHNGTFCWCKCSCLASSIPVETDNDSWKAIGEVKTGETVLAIDASGKWSKASVVYSDGSSMPEKPFPYAIYVVTENKVTLIVTPDHLFLMADGSLKRADRLAPSDRLVDKNKNPLKIVTLTSGNYHGPIHHIAVTNWNQTNPSIDGHLINTSGVISADYFAELFLQPTQSLAASPQIGSTEYLKIFSLKENLGASILKDTIQFSETTRFVPYKQKSDPKNALYFLPPGLDVAKDGSLVPLDNTIPYEMALYLTDHFKVYYPSINFLVRWTDSRVNAIAYMQGGKRYVEIFGGLLRHNSIQLEGASLVLAHEIGHHFGGAPRYPDNPWASCEGQADYWGALVGMRRVWFGQYAVENIQKGSVQLYNLFAYGLVQNLLTLDWEDYKKKSKLAGICTHPPALCRLDTYRAALRADPKPSCAGDPMTITSVNVGNQSEMYAIFRCGSIKEGYYKVLKEGGDASLVSQNDTPNFFIKKEKAQLINSMCLNMGARPGSPIIVDLNENQEPKIYDDKILAGIKCGEFRVGHYKVDTASLIAKISDINTANAYLTEANYRSAAAVCAQIPQSGIVFLYLQKFKP